MLHQKYKEQEKEFDKLSKFICNCGIYEDCPRIERVKSFHKQSLITLLETEIEVLEGRKFVDISQGGQFALHADGHNDAIEEHIHYLKTELEKIKQ